MKFFASLILFACSTSSFTNNILHQHKKNQHHNRRGKYLLFSSFLSDELDAGGLFQPLTGAEVELWLDLRQTSMPPQTALLHLTNDLWDEYKPPGDKSFIVDKVLMNMNDNLGAIVDDIRDEFETEIGVMIMDEGKMYEINEGGIMLPVGKGVKIEMDENGGINVNKDPLPVLDAVSKGEWVILDDHTEGDNASISNLVELVSSGAGVFNMGTTNADESPLSPGGLGLSCSTQARVMEMGALIQSVSGGKGFETTESGILVQSTENSSNSNGGVSRDGNAIEYAIAMPFDAMLWKTSSLIFGSMQEV